MKRTRKWLIYFEIFAVFVFFVIIFANITSSHTDQSSRVDSDLDQLMEAADQLYEIYDLPGALVKYWEAITQMEGQKGEGRVLIFDDVLATGGTAKGATECLLKGGYEPIKIGETVNMDPLLHNFCY